MRILWEDVKQISPDSLVHDADEDEIFKFPSFLRRAGEAEHCGRFSVEVGRTLRHTWDKVKMNE